MALLTLENNTENFLKNVEIETYSESLSFNECALTIVAESEKMWNEIIKEMAINELRYVAENGGAQMIYESVDVKKFFDEVLDFFKKMGAKIGGFFKKVFEWIEDHLDSNKAFVKKYEKDIKKGYEALDTHTDPLKIGKFYPYTNISNDKISKNLASDFKASLDREYSYTKVLTSFTTNDDVKKAIEDFGSQDTDKVLDAFRGALLDGFAGAEVSSSDFKEAAAKFLRGKEEDADSDMELTKNDIGSVEELIDSIKKCTKFKRDCAKSYNAAKKDINEMISDVKKYKKAIDKDDANKDAKLTYAKGIIQCMKNAVATIMTLKGAHMTAHKNRCKQSKAICTKLVELGKKAKRDEERRKEIEKRDNKDNKNKENGTGGYRLESSTSQFEDGYNFFTSDLF